MATLNYNMYVPVSTEPQPLPEGHLWTQTGRIEDAVALSKTPVPNIAANSHCQDPYYLQSGNILQGGNLIIYICSGYEIDVNSMYCPTMDNQDWYVATWNANNDVTVGNAVTYDGNTYTPYIYKRVKGNSAHTPIAEIATLSFDVVASSTNIPRATVSETEINIL